MNSGVSQDHEANIVIQAVTFSCFFQEVQLYIKLLKDIWKHLWKFSFLLFSGFGRNSKWKLQKYLKKR